jgi:protease-4
VRRLAEVKPVVAYLSNIAASGGYYIASAAHVIVAQPQTVTGSIGVVSTRLVVGPLLDRLGVATDVVKRGARADFFSRSRRLDETERAVFEREIDAVYDNFLRVVAEGRGRPVQEIEPLAQGRIYSGTEAHARGLVDHLGGLERAVHQTRELVGRDEKIDACVLRPPRIAPPPAPVPRAVQALVETLGLTSMAATVELALDSGNELALVYWPGEAP